MRSAFLLFHLLFIYLSSLNLFAQVSGKIIYSDTFIQNQTYCPTNTQYSNWTKFRNQLDTTNYKITKVTIKGTYDLSGRVCSDSFIARKLAFFLKNPPTSYSMNFKCGSHTWVVSALGTCYSNSSCALATDNVGIAADGQANACNCISQSYQIRPIIGNSNWGGINTASCPGPSQRMTLEFEYRIYPIDASISKVSPFNLCENPNELKVTIKNSGAKTIDSLEVGWSLNGNLQKSLNYKKALPSSFDTFIILKGGLYFTPYTLNTIKTWTFKPNGTKDNYPANDTFTYSFYYSSTPNSPSLKDTLVCGSGKYFLNATGNHKNDSLLWYNSKFNTSILGTGKIYKTNFLSPGIYKYYVSSSGQLIQQSIQTNFNGGNQQAGFMLDLKSIKTLTIDSFGLNIGTSAGALTNIEIYYREGSYVGYETSPSAWKLLDKFNVYAKGSGNSTNIPVQFSLKGGKSYGFYFQTTNAPSYFLQYGNLMSSSTKDETLEIKTGVGNGLNFGTVYSGRNGNLRVYYKSSSCEGDRDSLTIKVNKRPSGAEIIKGKSFDSPNLKSDGSKSNPDILYAAHAFEYEIKPPQGYLNADYGLTWSINGIMILNSSGKSITQMDTTFKNPSNLRNGNLKIIPSKNIEDSTLTILVHIKDLLRDKCDSLLNRVIYVAPSPKMGFLFKNVCLGTPIEFKNQCKISKGSISYKWHFGNNDTSLQENPIYTYPKFGSYTVKLTASSDFGISKDTSMTIAIYEVPSVSFKVINACKGDSLNFINNTQINSGSISYKWDLGDGKTSNLVNFKHLYYSAGTYFVTLTANSQGCSNTLTKKANQFEKPEAAFSFSGNCSKNPISFTNLTSIGFGENFASHWQFGDGEISHDLFPQHIYQTGGMKTIKFIATSQFGCKDSVIKSFNLFDSPEAMFSFGPSCKEESIPFYNYSIEPLAIKTDYYWEFGDGSTSNLKSPQYKYTNPLDGYVKLRAQGDNGCSTNMEKKINVLSRPIANFDYLDACTENHVVFIDKTVGDGFINNTWNFGDGDSSKDKSPLKLYNTTVAATYNVTLMVKNHVGCADTLTLPVNIKESPKCGFKYQSTLTGGYQYQFIPNNTNYLSYFWQFENGENSNQTSPIHTFQKDGNYRIRVIMSNSDGCKCEDSSMVLLVNHLAAKALRNVQIFNVKPNPSKNGFIIEFNYPKSGKINIYNALGKLYYSDNLQEVTSCYTFDKYLEAGIYFLTFSNDTGIYTQKIIISR